MDWTALYHQLPAALRSTAATARGLQLRRWRYGPETAGLVDEALERDTWPEGRLRSWQDERLRQMLAHAAASVPYYRDQWAERRRKGDRSDVEDLAAWPILSKDEVRRHQGELRAEDVGAVYLDRTSGTTGTPLTIAVERSALREGYAVYEARVRGWNGVALDDRWAILGGQMVVPPGQRKPPFWTHNWALRQLYVSANHVAPHTAGAIAAELERFRPTHLVAYPSSVGLLASYALAAGLSLGHPEVVIANAEAVSPDQRARIEQAFGCPVRETYGMGEMVGAASECGSGTLHWWPEAGFDEALDDQGQPVAPGEVGRLVLTGLGNRAMPLIRYEVGDRAAGTRWGGCGCGRTLPAFGPVEGRSQDTLTSEDGRKVFWLNPVVYGLPVAEAQLRQGSDRSIEALVVPAEGFDDESQAEILRRLQARVGDLPMSVRIVDVVPRDPSGKLRFVVSESV